MAPWMQEVAERGLTSVSAVARHAEDSLPLRWEHLRRTLGGRQLPHTTAFVFGFSGVAGAPERVSFSSRQDFQRERYARLGLTVRPQVPTEVILSSGAHEPGGDRDGDLLSVAKAVAAYDSGQDQPVGIGGTLSAIRIFRRGRPTTSAIGVLP